MYTSGADTRSGPEALLTEPPLSYPDSFMFHHQQQTVMNRLIFTILFTGLFSLVAPHSQAQSYAKGNLLISPGVSIGGLGYYGAYSGFSLPLELSGEYGFHEQFSGGLFAGFARFGYTRSRVSFINFGARGSWHYLPFLLEKLGNDPSAAEKIDLYASLLVGYQAANYRASDGSGSVFSGGFGNRGIFGIGLGGRYYFSPRLAAFAEIGRTVWGLMSIGVTLKL